MGPSSAVFSPSEPSGDPPQAVRARATTAAPAVAWRVRAAARRVGRVLLSTGDSLVVRSGASGNAQCGRVSCGHVCVPALEALPQSGVVALPRALIVAPSTG